MLIESPVLIINWSGLVGTVTKNKWWSPKRRRFPVRIFLRFASLNITFRTVVGRSAGVEQQYQVRIPFLPAQPHFLAEQNAIWPVNLLSRACSKSCTDIHHKTSSTRIVRKRIILSVITKANWQTTMNICERVAVGIGCSCCRSCWCCCCWPGSYLRGGLAARQVISNDH